jgi:glycosyltransferase involved in cell wall biosynthesis
VRLFVVEPFGRGGLIHFAYKLCSALSARGAEVTLVTSDDYELDRLPHSFTVKPFLHLWPSHDPDSEGLHRSTRMRAGWRRVRWSVRRVHRGVVLIGQWVRLLRLLLRERPDVVQLSVLYHPVLAPFLSIMAHRGLRLIQICHEYEERDLRGGWRGALHNWSTRRAYRPVSALFFLSRRTRESFLETHDFPAEHAHVIPLGELDVFVDDGPTSSELRARYGLAPHMPVVLFFGALRPSKGLPDLLEAFAGLPASISARLLIVGHPTRRADLASLRQRVSELGIADAVVIDPRYVPNEEVPGLMNLASVVALPYVNATQSAVLHLAHSYGRPVVVTRVGGLAETVDDRVTGLVVPPRSPADLREALQLLLADPALAAAMGNAARARLENERPWNRAAAEILRVCAEPCEPSR